MVAMLSLLGRQGQMSYLTISNCIVSTGTSAISNSGILTLPTSSGTYTITTTGGGGGGGGVYMSQNNWSVSSATVPSYDRDIVIKRPNGRSIKVGAVIEQLMEMLMLIPDDSELHERYPALKVAFDHHQNLLDEIMCNSKLKESYESYKLLLNLVRQEEDA